MRRQLVSLIVLVFVCTVGLGLYVFLSVSVDSREEASNSTVTEPTPLVMTRSITAGVILTGTASEFGWGDLAFVEDFAEITLAGQRVIVFENLNPTDRPDTTLEQVVADMAQYAGPEVYFLSAGRLTPDQNKVDEKFSNTIFVMNLATRGDVETLLGTLPATDSDLNRMLVGDEIAVATPESATRPDTDTSADPGPIPAALIIMVIVVLALGGLFGTWWKRLNLMLFGSSNKGKAKRRIAAGVHARGLAIEEAARPHATDFNAIGEPMPVIHKLTTYVSGDDHYDEGFPIELPDRTFLGECGVSFAAPVNRYDQHKITAFEAWMFDKNDIHTVSAMLLSEHAAQDRARRAELQSKGDTVEAKPGVAIHLETGTLRMRICVLAMQYGFSDTLPQRSFFDHIVIELAVWQK